MGGGRSCTPPTQILCVCCWLEEILNRSERIRKFAQEAVIVIDGKVLSIRRFPAIKSGVVFYILQFHSGKECGALIQLGLACAHRAECDECEPRVWATTGMQGGRADRKYADLALSAN